MGGGASYGLAAETPKSTKTVWKVLDIAVWWFMGSWVTRLAAPIPFYVLLPLLVIRLASSIGSDSDISLASQLRNELGIPIQVQPTYVNAPCVYMP